MEDSFFRTSGEAQLDRAKGCLFGQFIGDSLGGLVEFKTSEYIQKHYPDGVRDLADGGTFSNLAGQATDDSEMALALARTLDKDGEYIQENVRKAYVSWFAGAFDYGFATLNALGNGRPLSDTEANGAMMRVSPLGIWCAERYDTRKKEGFAEIARLARTDAAITHPTKVCADANTLYVAAIADAVRYGDTREEIFERICVWCQEIDAAESVKNAVENARKEPPLSEFSLHKGWVLVAFQNALYQLLHAENFEEALVDTISYGHDTDTNAAICGALMGAVTGFKAIPTRWSDVISVCRPGKGNPRTSHPKPAFYWPCDAAELAEKLLKMRMTV
ncbi:MAG: ADP-ribosylglycohydrolase family protein [Synergistaceae bacterium]|jgi:ADP-ribosylglycohydrolase|nr:ADP-ribosylglycohydrolase family protein [Synergistaceae bacterium]